MQDNSNTPDTIPYGFCHCGCGERTKAASVTASARGWVRGEPLRYVHGHNSRGIRFIAGDVIKKQCTKCDAVLELSMFGVRSVKEDGRTARCKKCLREGDRISREKHKDKVLERKRLYRRMNRDRMRDYDRKYRLENKDAIIRRKRIHYSKNRKRLVEQALQRQRDNPEVFRARNRDRRALIKAGGGSVSTAEWTEVLRVFNGKCAKCGSGENIEMDHVVPLARGGTHSVDNIQPLCRPCNIRKYTRTEDYRGKMYQPLSLPLDNDT